MILLTGKLLVSGFLILKTFTITVVQPTRELHLLRCLGASRSHLPGSALAESAIVALLASLVGLGVLIANGLRAPAQRLPRRRPVDHRHPAAAAHGGAGGGVAAGRPGGDGAVGAQGDPGAARSVVWGRP
jgi:predicted lysophospholipase L1 biosynthesis ABC-type transport system permease subunit